MKIGIGNFISRKMLAVNAAAQNVLAAQVADKSGNLISFGESMKSLGIADEMQRALKSVALELCESQLTFSQTMAVDRSRLRRSLRFAVERFYQVMEEHGIAEQGAGKGQLLLMHMDEKIEHYIAQTQHEQVRFAS